MVLLNRRFSGPQYQSGFNAEEKNSRAFSGIEPVYVSRVACTLVTILTELSQPPVVQNASFTTTSSDVLLKSTARVVAVALRHRQAESDHFVACLE